MNVEYPYFRVKRLNILDLLEITALSYAPVVDGSFSVSRWQRRRKPSKILQKTKHENDRLQTV